MYGLKDVWGIWEGKAAVSEFCFTLRHHRTAVRQKQTERDFFLIKITRSSF